MAQYAKLHPNDRCLLAKISCAIPKIEAAITNMAAGTQLTFLETAAINAPSLPYNIGSSTYSSYTIITTGSVAIDGVTVPEGTYSWSAAPGNTLTGKAITDVTDGSIIVLLQSL